jgi:hypothetical protein
MWFAIVSDRRFRQDKSPLLRIPGKLLRVRKNPEANAAKNLIVVNLAASDHEGEVALQQHGSMSSIVNGPTGSNCLHQVRTIRLADFTYRYRNPPPGLTSSMWKECRSSSRERPKHIRVVSLTIVV